MRHVMFSQSSHLITAPTAISVILMSFRHFGHGRIYSFISLTSNRGPLTIDGLFAIFYLFIMLHNNLIYEKP